jgi:hypothetical protein
VWAREGPHGVVNRPRIDAKDGIVASTASMRQAALLQRI